MNDAPEIRDLRRRLGQQLRSARQAAGYSQAGLARRAGYARSTVSTVESGGQHVPRRFWELCDAALGTGTALASASDVMERCRAAVRREPGEPLTAVPAHAVLPPDHGASGGPPGTGQPGTGQPSTGQPSTGQPSTGQPSTGPASAPYPGHGPGSERMLAGPVTGGRAGPGRPGRVLAAEVAAAYQRLGWRTEVTGDRVELVCGTVIEALEVPRASGLIAARWWLHTGGAPDQVRGLPALPGPAASLAVVAAGEQWFFLVQAGACPWSGAGLASAAELTPPALAGPGGAPRAAAGWQHAGAGRAGGPGVVVRWHADGMRIPAPPSRDAGGEPVTWACPPPARLELADPVVLLHLLARAVAVAGRGDQPLRLPGGMVVVPAAGSPAARAAG